MQLLYKHLFNVRRLGLLFGFLIFQLFSVNAQTINCNIIKTYKITDSDPQACDIIPGKGVFFRRNCGKGFQVWQAGNDLTLVEYANNTAEIKGSIFWGETKGIVSITLSDKNSIGSTWENSCFTSTLGTNRTFYKNYTGTIKVGNTSYSIDLKTPFVKANGASNQGNGLGLAGWTEGSWGSCGEIFANLQEVTSSNFTIEQTNATVCGESVGYHGLDVNGSSTNNYVARFSDGFRTTYNEMINESAWSNSEQEVSSFEGKTTGLYYVDLDMQSKCYNEVGNFKGIVDLDQDIIKIIEYDHFGDSSNELIGGGSNILTSVSSKFSKIKIEVKNNRLYFTQLLSVCSSTARILGGNIHDTKEVPLKKYDVTVSDYKKCIINWANLTKKNSSTIVPTSTIVCKGERGYLGVEVDGIDSYTTHWSDGYTSSFNEIIETKSWTNSNYPITNFGGKTSGLFYIDLDLQSKCYNSIANFKGVVDLSNYTIKVIEYKHFSSNTPSQMVGDGTSRVTSTSSSFSKIQLYFKNNRELVFNHISSACSSTARVLNGNIHSTKSIVINDNVNYNVTVKSEYFCTSTATQNFTVSNPPIASIIKSSNISCQNLEPTLTANPSGQSYKWSNGSTDRVIKVKNAGTYQVTVTNSAGCTADPASVTVTKSNLVSVGGNIFPNSGRYCNQGATPRFKLTGQVGQVINWQYQRPGEGWTIWQGGGGKTTSPSGNFSKVGTWKFRALVKNGSCNEVSSIEAIIISDAITVGGNISPSSGSYCYQGATPQFKLTGQVGQVVNWQYQRPGEEWTIWQGGEGKTTSPSGNFSKVGTWKFRALVRNGLCIKVSSMEATVTVVSDPNASITKSNDLTCANPETNLTANPSGQSYEWSNGSTNRTIKVSDAGTYKVTVTNSGGCSKEVSISVTADTAKPNASITKSNDITCTNNNANLTANPSGQSYKWSNGSTKRTITVGSAGNYTVTVTASNGCTDVASMNVNGDSNTPNASIEKSNDITCTNNSSTLTANPSGLNYKWSNGSTNRTINVDNGGNYSVTITGSNACSATASVAVAEDKTAPNASIDKSDDELSCTTTSLDLTANPLGLSYKWSNGSTDRTISVDAAGTYSVTVTGDNGCEKAVSIAISGQCDPKGSIGNLVWNDLNNNGIKDANESGLANVTVKLQDKDGNTLATTTTDNNGFYQFTNLDEGDYKIMFNTPSGLNPSTRTGFGDNNVDNNNDNNPSTGMTDVFTLSAGENNNSIDAGFVAPPAKSSIGNLVWNDLNNNGIKDSNESGLANVTVKLQNPNGNTLATTTTDNDGLYQFTNLDAGSYKIMFNTPDGFQTSPRTGFGDNDVDDNNDNNSSTGMTDVVFLSAGENNTTIDAGFYAGTVCDNLTFGGKIGFGSTCAGNKEVCNTSETTQVESCQLPTGGSGEIEYLWLKNEVSCEGPVGTVAQMLANPNAYNWKIIFNSNSPTYNPGELSTSTCFLRCARRTGCERYLGESNIVRIEVKADCGGGSGDGTTTESCGSGTSITYGNGEIKMEGQSGQEYYFHVFNMNWGTEFSCGWQCGSSQTATGLAAGDYRVVIKNTSWEVVCEKIITLSENTGGGSDPDNDGDGVPASQDCNDNDPNLTTEGASCDDGNANTSDDKVQSNCTCAGTDNGNSDPDNDGDGVPASQDCNDNDPNLTTEGASCDDGNANTSDDKVQSNCTCAGTDNGNSDPDNDGDGVPASQDCNDNDPNLTTEGASCDDGNANTSDDKVQSNCTCAGTDNSGGGEGTTTESCGNGTSITYGNGEIKMEGQSDQEYYFHVFNMNWGTEFSCGWQCGSSQTATGLAAGDYRVVIKNTSWEVVCEKVITLSENTGGGTGGGSDPDNDGDGVPASQDCNDNDPNLTTVGASCDDGNANTSDDKVQSNCTCAGTDNGNNDPDNDGDGVPASQDCNDNDPNLTTVGASCDDGNANTSDDEVQSNCTCAGTDNTGGGNNSNSVSCGELTISYGEGIIDIEGQEGQDYFFKVNDLENGWTQVSGCAWNCGYQHTVTDLPNSTYLVTVLNKDWSKHCDVEITMSNSSFTRSGESRNAPHLSFTAFRSNREVELQWLTNTGYKNERYEVEHSTDGESFSKVSEFINKEWTNEIAYHQSMDKQPQTGINYYRVKQVYVDGSFDYTDIKEVNFNIDLEGLNVFPNPATEELFVNLKSYIGRKGRLLMVNQFGQIVQELDLESIDNSLLKINTSDLVNGLYKLNIQLEHQKTVSKSIVIHHLY